MYYKNNYSSGSYPRQYSNYSGYNRPKPKKRSGCGMRKTENGVLIWGWRLSKGQMFSLYARPYKGTKIRESKSGKKWANLFVTITNKSTGVITNTSGLYDLNRERLYIKSLNQIANPRAPHGGYYGKHISKNYN